MGDGPTGVPPREGPAALGVAGISVARRPGTSHFSTRNEHQEQISAYQLLPLSVVSSGTPPRLSFRESVTFDFPGTANLPIGDSQDAMQENGLPRQHRISRRITDWQREKHRQSSSIGVARRFCIPARCFCGRSGPRSEESLFVCETSGCRRAGESARERGRTAE